MPDAELYCAVLICNSSPNPMNLVGKEQENGEWRQEPSATIAPNDFGYMRLAADTEYYGPNGSATYTVTGSNGATGQIKFFFSCPYSENNVLDWVWVVKPDPRPNLTAIIAGRSGHWDWEKGVKPDGSPVTGVYFVIN